MYNALCYQVYIYIHQYSITRFLGRKHTIIMCYSRWIADENTCEKTYRGGCKEWRSKHLIREGGFYTDRDYTVKECYALCSKHRKLNGKKSDCGGFFITKRACLLYKAGCQNNGDSRFQHYAMSDCTNIAQSNYTFYGLI